MKSKYITIAKQNYVNADIFKHDYIFLPAETPEEVAEIHKLNTTILADMIDARHEKRMEEYRESYNQLKEINEALREMLWLPANEY